MHCLRGDSRLTSVRGVQDTSFGTRLEICCEIRGENNLTQAVSDFCDAKRVNLLITASVALSSGRESALMGSISLSIVRNITHVPILVFKSNSAGSAFRMTADQVADPQLGGALTGSALCCLPLARLIQPDLPLVV